MSLINVLDDNTINKIAAGEVVEKPAAVIKELAENAIDAGSLAITIEIKNGGLDMMRITDNGRGIAPDDIRLAFERHATSKIRSIDDLNMLSSLGFRGEALASISSVARTECITKTASEITGIRYEINGGVEESYKEVGCPDGTTIVIRDLFFNTPARRKFLKTPKTEGSYISELVEKIALSHPEIAFRFLNNGKLSLNTTGCGRLKDVIYRIYGKDITDNIIPIEYENENVQITGYIGKSVISRGNRGLISVFVNGRYIKSPVIFRALDEGYNGYLMQHRFPFAVLMIKINPGNMDVNVHPSKQEIRFSDSDEIYRTICNAVKSTLKNDILIPDMTIDTPDETIPQNTVRGNNLHGTPVQGTLAHETPTQRTADNVTNYNITGSSTKNIDTLYNSSEHTHLSTSTGINRTVSDTSEAPSKSSGKIRGPEPFEKKRSEMIKEQTVIYDTTGSAEDYNTDNNLDKNKNKISPVQSLFDFDGMKDEKTKDFRVAGCVFSTYWIIEYHDEMYIMDQHAAHEKVLYEQFLKKVKIGKLAVQPLSPPVILTLTPAEAAVVTSHSGELEDMGFSIEMFGGNEYKICSVPADLPGIGSRQVLMDWIAMMSDDSGIKSQESVFMERLATMACKAAVKGGRHISEEEAYALVMDLFELENPFHCPHGRPTMIKMTKYELEKKFGRIV